MNKVQLLLHLFLFVVEPRTVKKHRCTTTNNNNNYDNDDDNNIF